MSSVSAVTSIHRAPRRTPKADDREPIGSSVIRRPLQSPRPVHEAFDDPLPFFGQHIAAKGLAGFTRNLADQLIPAGRLRRRHQSLEVLPNRSEERTSELQSLMRISYAVFCLQKKTTAQNTQHSNQTDTQNIN